MTGHCRASNALALLLLLTGASFLHPSDSHPVGSALEEEEAGRRARTDEERRPAPKDDAGDELFEDVDPKTLAAVLLEALNHSHVERRGEEGDRVEEERKSEEGEVKEEDTEEDLDGDQEIRRLLATRGNDKEKEEEEERRKAQEEEEAMTEKVTSRTTSHTAQVQAEHQLSGPGNSPDGAEQQKGPSAPEQGSNEKEEQLSSGELKSLEAMMKEFPRVNAAAKRDGDGREKQRESRGYSSHGGSTLAMSKKKLKWQEETQKAMNFPTFRGGNFMDDVVGSDYDTYAAQSPPPAAKAEAEAGGAEPEQREEEEEEEEEEEVLSPEEEEARARAEQEEMRRQAAEAQRAKMEEEKLADIASDMLLRYMVKQGGGRKYGGAPANAAEDKRSNEVLEVTEEDDIDPQTIDKLIEISSKLHLPADDVVDIISDVEKKKKKNASPEAAARWRRPGGAGAASSAAAAAALFPPNDGLRTPEGPDDERNEPVSRQPATAVNRLKAWFRDRAPTKSLDLWSRPPKPPLAEPGLRPKPQKPLPVYQDLWLKPPVSVWSSHRSYPSYYQRYPDAYPVYAPPPSRPKFRYYVRKPALNLDALLRGAAPRRYVDWARPWLRKRPLELQPRRYYASYPLPPQPWTFPPAPVPRSRPLPRTAAAPAPQRRLYYPAPAPAAEELRKMFMNRPRLLD
ncbi:neurosecretory protein VGF [Betta splendens]|uniref:Neurosecretory protein VGF n=1 Tax=Betta splendens TaxID=158456 RepID=A0A6P7LQQ6_BETSP|nr:neurosecretory protein VGF [Betta splendens]XP_028996188.1 neurosecretory protein VGF [Betta splendens]